MCIIFLHWGRFRFLFILFLFHFTFSQTFIPQPNCLTVYQLALYHWHINVVAPTSQSLLPFFIEGLKKEISTSPQSPAQTPYLTTSSNHITSSNHTPSPTPSNHITSSNHSNSSTQLTTPSSSNQTTANAQPTSTLRGQKPAVPNRPAPSPSPPFNSPL